MISKQSPILIIGAGSVGERHITNLLQSGYTNIHVLRRASTPMRTVDAQLVTIHTSAEDFTDGTFDCAVICNPTSMHAETTHWCLQRVMHVLVEKPLSHNLNHIAEIQAVALQKNLVVQVAYMMRYHPHLKTIASAIHNQTYGPLQQIETYWGSYLPDWHPWEDYRNSYVALKQLGGGVALTLSHDLDVVNWLAGAPILSYARNYAYVAELEIETESVADFNITYQNGISAKVHMNLLDKPQKRSYMFQFATARIFFDFFSSEMRIESASGLTTHTLDNFDRNNLFMDELHDFINRINRNEDHGPFTTQQISDSTTIIKMCI